jgi:hypothetical protein
VKFLFDEHMPPKLVRAIGELAKDEPYTIVHLRDRFPGGTKDVEWIGILGKEGGWAFISEDRRIRQRPHELAVLKQSNLIGVFLTKGWNQAGLWDRAALLIGWWPHIVAAATAATPGQVFDVPYRRASGTLKAMR